MGGIAKGLFVSVVCVCGMSSTHVYGGAMSLISCMWARASHFQMFS